MSLRLILASIFLLLAVPGEAFGQICGISHYPYGFASSNRPIMNGDDFKAVSTDLPFISEDERKQRYAQFWIAADVLNIRSGPGLDYDIISETYYGNLVFALAKRGDWVAIRRSKIIDGIEILPRWVHVKYLSSSRIQEQVGIEILKAKCDFLEQGTYRNTINDFSYRLANDYSPCGSVSGYLNELQLLRRPHIYVKQYTVWRKSQKNPAKYSVFNCQNP